MQEDQRMTATVRVKRTDGTIEMYELPIPSDIRDTKDAINDHISDFLDRIGIKYKWFRVITYTAEQNLKV